MKILFSSYHNPHFITITEYIEKAMERLKHSLISFDDRKFIIPGRIRERMLFLQNWDLNRINNKLISLASRCKPDLCLVAGGHRIFPDTIKKIKERGTRTVLWTIDPPNNFQPIINAAPDYDFIFCGGTEAQELLAKAGIENTRWLPFACDPEFHRPVEVTFEEKKIYGSDVAFVGSFYPNRAEIFEKISDFELKIWGPSWDKLPPRSPLRKLAKDIKLKPEEWIKIFSSSKINIAIHYQDNKLPCYQASPKVYETLACKGFLLADNQKDVKSLFEEGRHLAIFKDIEDLREKIRHYLDHPGEREKIANQGYQEVIQKHAYLHRLKEMFYIIETKGQ
jgi:spore maturation protein CgeB